METENKSNEINLLDILINIWNAIVKVVKWLTSVLGRGLQLLYRNLTITLILVIIGFTISQYFARSSNKQYEMGSMAKLNGVTATDIKEIGRQLTLPSIKHEISSFQHKLDLPKDIAMSLARVDFFDVIDYQADSIPDKIDFKRNHPLSDTLNIKMENFI